MASPNASSCPSESCAAQEFQGVIQTAVSLVTKDLPCLLSFATHIRGMTSSCGEGSTIGHNQDTGSIESINESSSFDRPSAQTRSGQNRLFLASTDTHLDCLERYLNQGWYSFSQFGLAEEERLLAENGKGLSQDIPSLLKESTDGGMSRSFTILLALIRFRLMFQQKQQLLRIHVIGADFREGRSCEETAKVFAPLFLILGHLTALENIQLLLIGPNVHSAQHLVQHKERIQVAVSGHIDSKECGKALDITITYISSLYNRDALLSYSISHAIKEDEANTEDEVQCAGLIAFCFNAGVWGYTEWIPTLKFLLTELKAPVVVTSYNSFEAEDDFDAIAAADIGARWLWEDELNPFGSTFIRESKAFENRILVENAYWQGLLPGGRN